MPNENEQFDALPPAIVDALRELDGPAVLPDAERDADVFSGARQHLRPVQRKRRNLRLFFAGSAGGALAAAAMIGIVVWLGNPLGRPEADITEMALQEAMPITTQPASPGDLDDNGSVDILDAYALARRLERGDSPESLDVDGNGSVDQRDIDWIASRAVALNHGEPG